MKGFFIFICNTEHDSFVAIVHRDISKLKVRIDEVADISKKYSSLADVSFWDNIDAYEYFDVNEYIDDERAIEQIEECSWTFVEGEASEPVSDSLRVSVARLHVDNGGVWWSFYPKHSDEVIETPIVSLGEIVELIGNLGAK